MWFLVMRPCSKTKGVADSIFSGALSMLRSHTDVVVALVGAIGALAMLDCRTRVSGFLLVVRQAPPGVARARHYVPVATFAALIVPRLAVPGEIAPCLVAAVCTGVVAVCLGKPWAARLVGMAVFMRLLALGMGAMLHPMIQA
jgi:branched-subunit amino acid transport protein